MENKEIYQVSKAYMEECNNRLILAKTALMLNAPFFGILIGKLKMVPNNTWCRTLAVDGKHLFYNVEFIMGVENPKMREQYENLLKTSIDDISAEQINDALNGLTDNNLVAAICHEILHCAYNHFLRRGNRNNKLWNKAADYAINQIIKRNKLLGEIRNNWLYNPDYEGMTAEQIYVILEEKNENGESAGGFGGTLDQHDIPQYESPEEQEKMKSYMDDFKEQMFGAILSGDAPADIVRMIDELKESKIDWRTKVTRTLKSLIKNNVSYTKPSRRTWGYASYSNTFYSPIFPGLIPDNDIDVCVALDASGSISPRMLSDFLSEVIGMTKQFTQFKIKILTFDTSVYEVHQFESGDEQKILSYPVTGGGGTNFNAVWEYMKKESYKPMQLIMFTDGEPFGGWGDENYCDTLFVIHSNPKKEAPFGSTVHYEFDDVT